MTDIKLEKNFKYRIPGSKSWQNSFKSFKISKSESFSTVLIKSSDSESSAEQQFRYNLVSDNECVRRNSNSKCAMVNMCTSNRIDLYMNNNIVIEFSFSDNDYERCLSAVKKALSQFPKDYCLFKLNKNNTKNVDYKEKYLKYKIKYLQLKKEFNL